MAVAVRVAEALVAVERHEEHAEGVQRRDEYTGEHAVVRVRRAPAMRLANRFDDGVLRIEAGEKRRTDQRQCADP